MFKKFQKFFQRSREKAGEWFHIYGQKLLLFFGILSAIALAFESGFLFGRDRQTDPIVITTPAEACSPVPVTAEESGKINTSETSGAKEIPLTENQTQKPSTLASDSSSQNTAPQNNESCVYVGSRNSDKYHLPKCSWAKRIKPENRVCFSSAEDAQSKGYKPGCVK